MLGQLEAVIKTYGMATVHHSHALLGPGFSVYRLGGYLGMEMSLEEQQEANAQAATFFEEFGLLPTRCLQVSCPYQPKNANDNPLVDVNGRLVMCNRVMKIAADKNRREGFRFRCRGGGIAFHPTVMLSPRTGTLFEKIPCEYRLVIKLLLMFLEKCPVTTASRFCASENAAIKYYVWIRKAVTTVAWHDFKEIGGTGDIVEVDTTPLTTGKCKVEQNKSAVKTLMFSAISRSTGKRFGKIVGARDSNTLIADMMMENVCMESFICSDDWTAYKNCDNYFTGHGVICTNASFVNPPVTEDPHWIAGRNFHPKCLDTNFIGPCPEPDPVLGVKQPVRFHVNRCKRQWADLKRSLPPARSKEHKNYHIGEWMYRHNNLSEAANDVGARFRRFLEDLRRVFPGPGIQPINMDRDKCECCDCRPQQV